MTRVHHRRLCWGSVLLLGALVGSCSSTGTSTSPPSATSSAVGFAPTTGTTGSTEVAGSGFQLSAPGGWTVGKGKNAQGLDLVRLTPARTDGTVVAVIRDEGRRGNAKDQSTILYELEKGPNRSRDVTRTLVR